MTHLPDDTLDRRSYVRRLGITAAALGGLSTPAVASGDDTLAPTPGAFSVYYSTDSDSDSLDDFDFPSEPFLGGPNPGGDEGLFDSSEIRITPNRDTLHHELQVFAGLVMKDDPKPYTLVNEGDGLFEARGQTVNFTARSKETIGTLLGSVGLPPELADAPPLSTLAEERWRAVATEQLKVELEPPFNYEWASTRVDFYSRGDGPPEHSLSLIYALWADTDVIDEDDPQTKAIESTEELITSGRLNMGGQQTTARENGRGNRP